jgi:hypothetical protein
MQHAVSDEHRSFFSRDDFNTPRQFDLCLQFVALNRSNRRWWM